MLKIISTAKRRLAVYDLDGCLINSLWRYRTVNGKIDLPHWRSLETRSYEDGLLPLHKKYLADLADPHAIVIIATARVMHDSCDCFIRDKLGTPNAIISRKEGDSRGGALLKIKGLNKLFNLKGFQEFNSAVMHEDNLSYLKDICTHFPGFTGVYIPSEQGH